MKDTILKPINVGDAVSTIDGRTNEGTPISLTDFHGRALAVFFVNHCSSKSKLRMFKHAKSCADLFLNNDYSPIFVSEEEPEILESFREMEELPFILISDVDNAIHNSMCGQNNNRKPGSFLIDDDGKVVAVLPVLPPEEQVVATMAAVERVSGE